MREYFAFAALFESCPQKAWHSTTGFSSQLAQKEITFHNILTVADQLRQEKYKPVSVEKGPSILRDGGKRTSINSFGKKTKILFSEKLSLHQTRHYLFD